MNNFKVLMNGIIKENPTFSAPAWYVSYVRHYFVCYQWYGYGIGYNVRAHLF